MTYIEPAPAPAQEASPTKVSGVVTTFKQRDAWSRKIARDLRLKLMHRHVLRSLALCTRVDGDGKFVIDPTYVEIARAAGCCKRVAQYAVAAAEEIGIIRKAWHSDGRVSNAFELVANGSKKAEKAPEKTQQIQCPTVHGFATSEGSNGASACTVLRVKRKEEEGRKKASKSGPSGPQAALVETQHLSANGNKCADAEPLNLALKADIPETEREGTKALRLCSACVEVEEPTETQPTAALSSALYGWPVANAAAGTVIDRAGHAARRPETKPPHHKGTRTMPRIARIQSREEMFVKIKNFYPVIGLDDAINFEAFGLALDHGCDFFDLFEEVLDQRSFSKDGRDVPSLAEFLVSKCWSEAIAA